MRFIHAADIHLGSPLGGLDLHDDAPVEEIRSAPRRAFERLIDYCCESSNEIDLLLIAGDLFDGKASLDTTLFVERQLRRATDVGVRIVLLRGNHDAASKQALGLKLGDGAHELSTARPETVTFEDIGVAVHGQGFAEQHVPDSIVDDYPAPVAGMFNIGLLHTSATGTGDHEVYAPCTLSQLTGAGYDYWALGHIHIRQELCAEPWVIFCGNIQGRHPKETGAKGATLVEVDGASVMGAPAHVPFDVLRWHTITVDLVEDDDANDMLAQLQRRVAQIVADADADMQHAVRIDVTGRARAHRELTDQPAHWNSLVHQAVAEAGADRVWIERARFLTEPPIPPLADIRAREDMVGDLARSLQTMEVGEATASMLDQSLAGLRGKLPAELLEGDAALSVPGLTRGLELEPMLVQAERDLLSRLVSADARANEEGA